MLRVLGLTGGVHVPSARFRVGQFAGRLAAYGVDLVHRPSRVGCYPPATRWRRAVWLPAILADRMSDVIRTHAFDLTLLQRELVSTLLTFEPLARRPRVFDVDDALWLLPRGSFARRLAAMCDAIICGNGYLAEYFGRFNRVVYVLPTAVDTDRFRPPIRRPERATVVIGWTGSRAGLPYLNLVEDALGTILRARPQATFRVVADAPPVLRELPAAQVEYLPWSEDGEVAALQGMDIGIMPLPDRPWERGKCAYKMLLYFACGMPAVVSPVGMNADVLKQADAAFGATGPADWVEMLVSLIDDLALRQRMGDAGRRLVDRVYSLATIGPALAGILRSVA